ncbi:MAG: tyrosine-type recombinase/integrase [Geminicoccaceae bacterium]
MPQAIAPSPAGSDSAAAGGRSWARLLPLCAQDPLADSFLDSLALRRLAWNSILAYGRAVESLIAFGGPLSRLRLDRPTVHRFVSHLLQTPSCKPGSRGTALSRATVQQRVSGLRAFADYLVDVGRLDRNPVPRGRAVRTETGEVVALRRGPVPGGGARRLPRLPTDEQWQLLVAAVACRGARDRLMFALSYDGALRRGELASLALDDFDFSARLIHLRPENTKSGERRTVVYSEPTGELLRAWLSERRKLRPRTRALFVSRSRRNRGRMLGSNTWARVAAAIAAEAGVPSFTPHALRHLRLTDLARAGLDVKLIAAFAGHRSIQSTMLYLHLGAGDIARAFHDAAARLAARTVVAPAS